MHFEPRLPKEPPPRRRRFSWWGVTSALLMAASAYIVAGVILDYVILRAKPFKERMPLDYSEPLR